MNMSNDDWVDALTYIMKDQFMDICERIRNYIKDDYKQRGRREHIPLRTRDIEELLYHYENMDRELRKQSLAAKSVVEDMVTKFYRSNNGNLELTKEVVNSILKKLAAKKMMDLLSKKKSSDLSYDPAISPVRHTIPYL